MTVNKKFRELKMKDKFIEQQAQKLTDGLINRRKFMTSVLATGLTVPAALSLSLIHI